MTTLNDALSRALRDIMTDRGVSQNAVAAHLDRSANYVSGRLTGKHALSVDIVSAVAQLAGVSDRTLMAEVMSRVTGTGHGSLDL